MSITLSILIPTLGRKKCLLQVLSDLLPQLTKYDEIIVLDQNSPGMDKQIFPPDQRIRVIQSKTGLTYGRNLLIQKSSNSHLLFLDDDLILSPDLIKEYKSAIKFHPKSILAGKVITEDSVNIPPPGNIDFFSGEIVTNFAFERDEETFMFAGGNFLIPRKSLPPNPVFNPWFRGSAQGEEVDFALRLTRAGHRIHSVHKAWVHHLKLSRGGCRNTVYRDKFIFHQCFNEGMFFGRFCHLGGICKFLIRMKNFWEFHSRWNFPGHHPGKLGALVSSTLQGILIGLFLRAGDKKQP